MNQFISLLVFNSKVEQSFETTLYKKFIETDDRNLQVHESLEPFTWEFHKKKSITYNLRIQDLYKLPTLKTLGFGLDSLPFRGSFPWNTLDDSIKQEPTLSRFKKKINE